jgi:hypothetical protein
MHLNITLARLPPSAAQARESSIASTNHERRLTP